MSQTFTVEQLKKYDGKSSDKIYVAVAGQVFDVTDEGKAFYAPGENTLWFVIHLPTIRYLKLWIANNNDH